ncbi:hypothetical protein LOCC1_G002591 [Lachnellula occidentalis]|uniref:C2H2-type domain-containing protein n=1 Tax=Lachnellula occidentalis TaxID=215460 RepID=A0A8H8S7Q8_9HELO|nr:hypothetical protein LOCC1_G002591 [Lachnellula occidentalis]
MDSFYIDSSTEDSRQSRSRANSHLSTTASHFRGLNILESIPSSTLGSSDIHPSQPPRSFPYQDRTQSSSSIIDSPASQQLTPFPLLSQSDLHAEFSYLESTRASTEGLALRFEPESYLEDQDSVGEQSSISRSNSIPANMSTMGIQQYDTRFEARPYQSYTWPHFEMNDQFIPQISSPHLSPNILSYEEPKMMPIYARSISSSPPRTSLTPEQRELKRQRDHARRDSKTRDRVRRERSTSNPYVVSQRASPELLPRTLPEYTTSLTPSPLLASGALPSQQQAQPSPALSSSSYLTPYSPQLAENGQSDMYSPVFTMSPNDFTSTPTFNSLPYSNAGPEPSIHSFVGRPHSHSLSSVGSQPSLYQHQLPKIGSSDHGDHVRVVHSRPKPQCWEHGCNGRQFSTFSNLLRHQREKSGAAAKSSCPNCGAEFTRTTARNGHMAHEKCKQRRDS